MQKTKKARLQEQLDWELKWMIKCGGDLVGYINNYHHQHGRSVESAEAIYRADCEQVKKIEAQIEACK